MEKILALDLGVTSIGYTVVNRKDDFKYELLDCNVWMRNTPYSDSGDSSKKLRRGYKSQRDLIKKRKKRACEVRNILIDADIVDPLEQTPKYFIPSWELRGKKAYKQKLTQLEFLNLMQFFAKHRGYKSLKVEDMIAEIEAKEQMKVDCENSEDIKPPSLDDWQDRLAYLDALKCQNKDKTVGQIIYELEMQTQNPTFRNHGEHNYRYIIKREDIEKEIDAIFQKQYEFGFFNDQVDVESAKRRIKQIILTQDELQPIESMINNCSLDKTQKCASTYSYSYDYFKLLKIANELNIDKDTKLTKEQRDTLLSYVLDKVNNFKNITKLTVKEVRKLFDLETDVKINNMLDSTIEKGKKKDNVLLEFKFFAKVKNFEQKLLKKVFKHPKKIEILDALSYAVLIHTSPKALIQNAQEVFKTFDLDVSEQDIQDFILSLYKYKPKSNNSGKYSFQTLYKLIDVMEKDVFGEALAKEKAGYKEHKESYEEFVKGLKYLNLQQYEKDENVITNHSVKSIVSGALRLIKHLSNEYGEFDKIKIESARELSVPDEVKNKIKKSNDDRLKEKERVKKEYAKFKENLTKNDIKKILLWESQNKQSLYRPGVSIGIEQLLSERVEIEHIIPRALGGVSAEYNLIVDFAEQNAQKGNRLPMDFLSEDIKEQFIDVIDTLKAQKNINFKKWINLKAQNLDKTFHEIRDSNLMHATSYAEILLGDVVKRYYPFKTKEYQKNGVGVEHIQGRATSHLRKVLEIDDKSRDTNFHHVEDALLVSVTSKSYLQKLSKVYRQNYGKEFVKRKEFYKDITPFIEGATLNDVIHNLRQKYEQDIENNPFFRDFNDKLRSVKFFVSNKPIDTKAHNETIQSNDYSYKVSWSNLLGALNKPTFKTDATKFAKDFDKHIASKIKVVQENPNDKVAQAVLKFRDEVVQLLNSASFVSSEDEKDNINQKLTQFWNEPLKDAQGKKIQKIKRVGEKASIDIRGGKAATAPSLHYVKFTYGTKKFEVKRVDVRNSVKELKQQQPADVLKVYENDLIEVFKEVKKQLQSDVVGIVKGFTESRTRTKFRNPKFPTIETFQPKEYTKWQSIGALKGIKKYDIDIIGKVKGYYRLGRVLVDGEIKESKVVLYEKIKE